MGCNNSLKTEFARGNIDQDETLDQYINMETKQWNESLISDVFNSIKVKDIKSIPLCRSDKKDCIVWHYQKNGKYNVKSDYRFLMSNEENEEQGKRNKYRGKNNLGK